MPDSGDTASRRLQAKLADREYEIETLRARIRELKLAAEAAAPLQDELAEAQRRLTIIESSLTWRAAERAKGTVTRRLGGEDSLPVRSARRGLGRVARRRQLERAPEAPELHVEVEFPQFSDPEASLVIPVYAGAGYTRACLHSIAENTGLASYEVIIVDDGEDPETKELLAGVRGARILTNEANLGYLRSVNRGAAEARGRWLVLCNNDIEVQEHWLSELVACGESADDIAIVTPKYLAPDYSLLEAGGIIWRDGTGYNYGREESPGEPRYEFRREVDYGSAAALLVRADFWREVGGYDERFEPMYYEDTDLCFEARERGYRVVYEPRANVIHAEGSTAGTDITKGHKRHQEINRRLFVAKWRHRLEADHLGPGTGNLRGGAERHHGTQVLIIDHRVPSPDRDSGSLRMQAMIDALIELGCRITFLPDDRHPLPPYTIDLQHQGVEVWYGQMEIVEELEEIGPHLAMAIISRPHVTARWLDLIRGKAPTVPVFYDTVDLHYLREQRRAESEGGVDALAHGSRAAALRELELAMLRASDASFVVTEAEGERIRSEVPGSVVRVVPNINRLHVPVPPREGREGLVFIGGFEHTPNIDAAIRLVRQVMPFVWRTHPDVPVRIIGSEAPTEVEALASRRVEIAGWVPEVESSLDGAVAMVAPLSYGAGLKGKVTQALAAGLPVVTTSIGAEGLEDVAGEALLWTDEDEGLAAHITQLIDDAALWQRLSAAGQQVARERFSAEVMRRVMGDALELADELRASGPPTLGIRPQAR